MSRDTAVPSSSRTWQASAAVLVVAWMVLFGLVVVVGLLLTGPLEASVGSTDNDLAGWFVGERSSSLNQVAEFLTLLAETSTVIVLALVVALAFWVWQRNVRLVLFVVLTTAGSTGIYLLATNAVDRARPPVKILDPGLDPTHSFPSGHVAAATALYGAVVILVWTYARAARWWVTPLLVLPLLVGVGRLYEGAHHLSDVLTSLLYAAAWLTVMARTLLPGQQSRPVPTRAENSRETG